MRKKRDPETDEQRSERSDMKTQRQIDDAAQADRTIDAMVKQSIQLHGA